MRLNWKMTHKQSYNQKSNTVMLQDGYKIILKTVQIYKNTQRKFTHTSSSLIYKYPPDKLRCKSKQTLQRHDKICPRIQHKIAIEVLTSYNS